MYIAKTKALISFAVILFWHMQNVGFLMTWLIYSKRTLFVCHKGFDKAALHVISVNWHAIIL